MKAPRYAAAVLTSMLLSGCLEVRQHPAWVDGAYAGKHDNRSAQVKYHNDKLAWFAAISDRMMNQNEYNRANP
jgi:outer membrane murein-binding lipoprotein Lpp